MSSTEDSFLQGWMTPFPPCLSRFLGIGNPKPPGFLVGSTTELLLEGESNMAATFPSLAAKIFYPPPSRPSGTMMSPRRPPIAYSATSKKRLALLDPTWAKNALSPSLEDSMKLEPLHASQFLYRPL
ncbi:hypothetical protein SLA2020_285260 [Shorea laevis]